MGCGLWSLISEEGTHLHLNVISWNDVWIERHFSEFQSAELYFRGLPNFRRYSDVTQSGVLGHSSIPRSSRRWSSTNPVSRRSWVWRSATGRTTRRILGFTLERWRQQTLVYSSSLHSFLKVVHLFTPAWWFVTARNLIQFLTRLFLYSTFHQYIFSCVLLLLHPSINHFIHHLIFGIIHPAYCDSWIHSVIINASVYLFMRRSFIHPSIPEVLCFSL